MLFAGLSRLLRTEAEINIKCDIQTTFSGFVLRNAGYFKIKKLYSSQSD